MTSSVPLLFLVMVPIATLIAVLAVPIISFLYGARWLPAAEPLRFLMVLMLVRMLTGLSMDILMSSGATKLTLLINIGWAVIAIPALWLGTSIGGVRGTAVVHAAVGVLVAIPLAAVALRRVGVRLGPLGKRMVRPLLAGALTGAVVFPLGRALAGLSPFVQLAVAGTTGLMVYLVAAIPRDDLRAWRSAVRAETPLSRAAG